MDSALIIANGENGSLAIHNILKSLSFKKITTAKTCGEARRICSEQDFDLYIINSPVGSESGEDLAKELVHGNISQVIFLANNDGYDYMANRLEAYGIITVAKPINKNMLIMALNLSKAVHSRMQSMQNTTVKLTRKIEDIRIIDRAKCVLISHLGMSEGEAHKHIEKKAMDTRASRREVAEGILKVYEN